MSETVGETGQTTIGVASLNVLLDKTRSGYDSDDPHYVEPQIKRVDSLSQTLGSLPISLDVVMLQEVHVTKTHHCGEEIAERLGFENGFWFNHNTTKRSGEFIGVCGNLVAEAEKVNIGYDKLAIVTEVGGIAIIGTHLRRTSNPLIKAKQMRNLLERTSHYPKRLIVGDGNARPNTETREILRQAGAQSVFLMKTGKYPDTWPTSNYRNIMLKKRYQRFLKKAYSIDMFEAIGFDESDFSIPGTVDTPKSDHYALYGEVKAA